MKLQADELMSFVEETSRDQRHGLDEVGRGRDDKWEMEGLGWVKFSNLGSCKSLRRFDLF